VRAALLPAGPDPYLLAYWLRNYATWSNSVDSLHVIMCGQRDLALQDYVRGCVEAVQNATVSFAHDRMAHGLVIDLLLAGTKADTVVLCETDAFVRRPEVVAECFGRIESGEVDLVGSTRGYGSPDLFARAEVRFGRENSQAFSPAFLFARTDDLRKVEPEGLDGFRFCGTRWGPGQYIESLDMTPDHELNGDTFVGASFQLRAMGLRCEARAAYRSYDANSDGPWFHVGSLSEGYGVAFLGPSIERENAAQAARQDPTDWPKRLAWWLRAWRVAGGPQTQHEEYFTAISNFMFHTDILPRQVRDADQSISPLVTWAES
jgi:hypothetical protein